VPPERGTPTPGRTAEQALDAVLAALARDAAGRPRHGPAAVYAHASDRMRSLVGDAAAFERAFRTTLYAPLVGHRMAATNDWDRLGNSARCHLSVVGADGLEAGYTVALTRSAEGARGGRWLLSGIVRDGVEL